MDLALVLRKLNNLYGINSVKFKVDVKTVVYEAVRTGLKDSLFIPCKQNNLKTLQNCFCTTFETLKEKWLLSCRLDKRAFQPMVVQTDYRNTWRPVYPVEAAKSAPALPFT